jgi:MTH538 TIR-like domain (DUF1863)
VGELVKAGGCTVLSLPRDLTTPVRVYKLFISHAWDYDDEYRGLEKLLNQAPGFQWQNLSVPSHNRIHTETTSQGLRAALEAYVRQADCVLICSGMYCAHREWIQAEIELAQVHGKPVIGVEPWGQERIPNEVRDAANKMVGWNTTSIVNAITELAPAAVPHFVSVTVSTGVVHPEVVDSAMTLICCDWFRFAWNSYLLWTEYDCASILRALRTNPELTKVYMVVCAVQENDNHAFLSFEAWNWVARKLG